MTLVPGQRNPTQIQSNPSLKDLSPALSHWSHSFIHSFTQDLSSIYSKTRTVRFLGNESLLSELYFFSYVSKYKTIHIWGWVNVEWQKEVLCSFVSELYSNPDTYLCSRDYAKIYTVYAFCHQGSYSHVRGTGGAEMNRPMRQSMIHATEQQISLHGSWLEMLNLRPIPELLNLNLHLNLTSRWFPCTLKFEKCCFWVTNLMWPEHRKPRDWVILEEITADFQEMVFKLGMF